MKIDIQFDRPIQEDRATHFVSFSIVGGTYVPTKNIIEASQKPGGMREIEQKILTELSALIQVELYGRVLSNEGEKPAASDKSEQDSKESKALGGIDNQSKENEATGSGGPIAHDGPTAADFSDSKEIKKTASQD